jgi:HK97 gp10 family phage protein
MPISGRVIGKQAVLATLAALPELARAELGEAIRVTASEVVRNAKATVPVDTGTLRDHIGFSFSPKYASAKIGITPGTVVIKGRAHRASHYAHMVEFGARGGEIPARSFLGAAFRGQQSPLESRMRAAQAATLTDLANMGSR